MERFTNRSDRYWDELMVELGTLEGRVAPLAFQYIEIGQRGTHGFSLTRHSGLPSVLFQRVWNPQTDGERFSRGIYNLDRLAVFSHSLAIDKTEEAELDRLFTKELILSGIKPIVLDGLFCQLKTKDKTISWNLDQEMNVHLQHFVSCLREKVKRHSTKKDQAHDESNR